MKKQLLTQLMVDEGLKLKPYKDSVGKLTIGYGRNLDDNGISQAVAENFLRSDLKVAIYDLDHAGISWWRDLSNRRQEALINMCFNLGLPKLILFEKMLVALKLKEWKKAHDEALDSKWAGQVGDRAIRIATAFQNG